MKIRKLLGIGVAVCMMAAFMISCGSSNSNSQKSEVNTSVSSNGNDTVSSELPEVVNIGVQTLVTPELIARYQGVYEEYMGCKVNLVQFDSGADINRAFASKSIDIGAIGTSPASIGISTELGYEVFWFEDVIGAAESLVAKKDSGITSVKDLVGKKVATPFASTAHFSLQNAMELNGVKASEVELYDMQADDIFAAWTRGDIDAAYVWDPVLSKLFADEGVSITNSAELADKGIVTADLAVINKEFAEKYPSVATGYIKAQIEAVNMFNNDREGALALIAEAIDISKEEAETQANGFIYPSGEEQLGDAYFGEDGNSGSIAEILKQAADFLVSQGSIDTAPDLSVFEEYSTGEYILRALNE